MTPLLKVCKTLLLIMNGLTVIPQLISWWTLVVLTVEEIFNRHNPEKPVKFNSVPSEAPQVI